MRHRDDPTREPPLLRAGRRFAYRVFGLYFKLTVSGSEHLPASGPVLIAGNHSGFLDGPITMIVLPRPSAFLVKSELFDTGFRWLLRFARQIPITRGTPDRTGLRRGLEVLGAGGVLGVFPEGTRGAGELTEIQHGIGYLALGGHCPIVPVVCLGTADALPKGKAVPKLRAPIEIVFGEPFTVTPVGDPRTRAAIAAAAEQIRLGLVDHLVAVSGERPGHG